MKKSTLFKMLDSYDDEDDINLNEIAREQAEYEKECIENLEEAQHQSGFYAFQDLMEMYRLERYGDF